MTIHLKFCNHPSLEYYETIMLVICNVTYYCYQGSEMVRIEKCIAQWYNAELRAGCSGLGIFLFTTASKLVLGSIQPPIQWVPGALSLGVKRPGRQADYSPSI
jgi:hypothetical protein